MKVCIKTLITALFIVSIVVSGCDIINPSNNNYFSSFTIETNKLVYASDEKVEVIFKNDTSQRVLFTPCHTKLKRLENDEWLDHSFMFCTTSARQFYINIEPGEIFSHNVYWFSNNEPQGIYRVEFQLTDKLGNKLPLEKRVTPSLTLSD